MQQAVTSLWYQALDTLFPPRCLSCGVHVDAHGVLCNACWTKMKFISAPVCASCGHPFSFPAPAGTQCGHCIQEEPSFDIARSVFAYDDHSRRLVLGLKYADKTHLVPTLGTWLARVGEEIIWDSDVIVPVPLHPLRLLKRRFNQSALLARTVAASSGLEWKEALKRIRHTPTQAGLTRKERRENVKRAFAYNARYARLLKDRRVLLVDDVMTTGATIEACTHALKKAGAKKVNVLTLARAVLD